MQQSIEDIQPIIICGTGRSGTSIFTKILSQHTDIWAFRWESQIFSGMPGLCDIILSDFNELKFKKFQELTLNHLYKRNVRNSYYAGLFEIIDFSSLSTALKALEDRVLSDCSQSQKMLACKVFVDQLFLPPAEKKSAKYWCEKTPRNIFYADTIRKIYPNVKFIHVVRDGRDVLSSLLEKKFWPVAKSTSHPATSNFSNPMDFEKAAPYWTTLIDIGIEQEQLIGPKQWLNIRLEDLVNTPRRTIAKVLSFLGLEKDIQIIDLIASQLKAKRAKSGRWERDLSKDQVKKFLEISSKNLNHFGYK